MKKFKNNPTMLLCLRALHNWTALVIFVGVFYMELLPIWKNLSLDNLTEIIEGVVYTEDWKDVEGYEGMYQVSSFGRLKSLSRVINVCGVQRFSNIEKILRQRKTHKGYLCVKLSNNGLDKNPVVHRIVAKKFILNPEDLPEVNHIKGVKTDNRVHQLEWMSHRDNCKHAYREGIATISEKQRKAVGDKNRLYCGAKHYMSKIVLDTQMGIYYDSASQAAKSVPMPESSLYEKLNGRAKNTTKFIYV